MGFTKKEHIIQSDLSVKTYRLLFRELCEQVWKVNRKSIPKNEKIKIRNNLKKCFPNVANQKKINVVDNYQYYVKLQPAKTAKADNAEENHVNSYAIGIRDLYFDFYEYSDYMDYWFDKTENLFVWLDDNIEMGHCTNWRNGDRSNAFKANYGYIYVFGTDESLKYAFFLEGTDYQELTVSGGKCNHNKKKGKKSNYCYIKNYYTKTGTAIEHMHFYFSKVKLTEDRLFGTNGIPKFKIQDCGMRVLQYMSEYNGLQFHGEGPGGNEILDCINKFYQYEKEHPEYNWDNEQEIFEEGLFEIYQQDVRHWHLAKNVFEHKTKKGEYIIGQTLYAPNPTRELRRRAATHIAYMYLYNYEFVSSPLSKQRHIFQIICMLLNKDGSRAKYIDLNLMKKWQNQYNNLNRDYLKRNKIVVDNLLEWLKSDILRECMLNMLYSKNSYFIEHAVNSYNYSLTELTKHKEGTDYLKKEMERSDSFYNIIFKLKGNKEKLFEYVKHEEIESDELTDKAILSGAIDPIGFAQKHKVTISTKLTLGYLGLIHKTAGIFVELYQNKIDDLINDYIGFLTKGQNADLQLIKIKVLGKKVWIIEQATAYGKLKKFFKKTSVTGLLIGLDALNLANAANTLAKGKKEDRYKDIAAFIAAVGGFINNVGDLEAVKTFANRIKGADEIVVSTKGAFIAKGNLFAKGIAQKLAKGAVKYGPYLSVASSAIDFAISAYELKQKLDSGDQRTINAQYVIITGKFIVLVGTVIVVFAPTAIFPPVTIAIIAFGAVMDAGASAYLSFTEDQDRLNVWLRRGIFGTDSKLFAMDEFKWAKGDEEGYKNLKIEGSNSKEYVLINTDRKANQASMDFIKKYKKYPTRNGLKRRNLISQHLDNEMKTLELVCPRCQINVEFTRDSYGRGGTIRFEVSIINVDENAYFTVNMYKMKKFDGSFETSKTNYSICKKRYYCFNKQLYEKEHPKWDLRELNIEKDNKGKKGSLMSKFVFEYSIPFNVQVIYSGCKFVFNDGTPDLTYYQNSNVKTLVDFDGVVG